MKDIFNETPTLLLYENIAFGVCSVLLGTALFAAGAQSASADEATAASGPAETAASETQPAATESSQAAQPAATESSQAEAPAASPVYGEGAPAPKVDRSNSVSTSESTSFSN